MFHCGWYPEEEIYEQHTNFFIVAASPEIAQEKIKIKLRNEKTVEDIQYHIDGMIEIDTIEGYKIVPEKLERWTKDYQWEVLNRKLM